MRTFGVTQNVSIAFRVRSSYKESLNLTCVLSKCPKVQVLDLRLGYFKMILHMHIVFRARSSLKGIQTIQMGFFETWVLHLGLFFHFNLKYLDLYLPLATRILGFRCNTYTRTYLYQLEIWGIIAILALVLTFTNWDFGAQLQYLHLTIILSLSCVFAFHTFCAILDFRCVLNT